MNKLWTYIHPSGRKYQLNYILIRNKWRNSNTNVEAYSSYSSTGSYHGIVSSNVRLSLRSNKNQGKSYITDLFLKTEKSLQDRYTVEINTDSILKMMKISLKHTNVS